MRYGTLTSVERPPHDIRETYAPYDVLRSAL